MSSDCTRFRALLEQRLGGEPDAQGALLFSEHLRSCPECSELLASEDALDLLLATLPDPQLPPALARRVLARLASAREAEAALDHLLESSLSVRVPADLSHTILARLAAERAPRGSLRRWTRTRIAGLAAALLALAGGAWWLQHTLVRHEPAQSADVALAGASDVDPDAPPAELLGSLDVLESWEILRGDDLDGALLSLDTIDEVLLDMHENDAAQSDAPPSKG